MTIRWDSVLVRHLALELNDLLAGSRMTALRLDGTRRDLTLAFRDRTLLWRLHPERGFLRLLEPLEPQSSDLRMRARVRRVVAPPDERIMRFELLPERGRTSRNELIVELLGNQWNAVVTEGSERVMRHVLMRREGRRPLVVGQEYRPPPATDREGVSGDLDPARWRDILRAGPEDDRPRALVRGVAWTSTLNANAILGPAALETSDDGLERAYARWRTIAAGSAAEPVLLVLARGLQPYPVPLDGISATPVESLLDGFERCAVEAEASGDTPVALSIPPELIARLEDAVHHGERRAARLRAELKEADDPQDLRAVGDLILARYGDIRPGAEEATLTGFDGSAVHVVLDPAAAPNENADRYYDRAGRAARARERLPELIRQADAGTSRLKGVLERARAGAATADEVRAAVPSRPTKQRGRDAQPSLPYKTFRSSGGLEIRVGRGSRHNDDLTFRHSSPGDVWLHARHAAGAHVVLRWPGPGAPPSRDLTEAAVLAAVHSKARTSGNAPVDWTYRKYVRKPRGSAPGSVVPERVQTIFVEPDAELAEGLAAKEEGG